MTSPRKKLIEVALPLDAINAASAREKSIRHGHPSTLHLWWARRPLRDLLLEAIRYGEQPEVRARLDTAVDQALDHSALQDLLEERQLVHNATDASRLQRVREEMERAEARRLQSHYIVAFFLEAFQRINGSAQQRGPDFGVTSVNYDFAKLLERAEAPA